MYDCQINEESVGLSIDRFKTKLKGNVWVPMLSHSNA